MYNTITIEERNKPAVALCHKDYMSDARSAASNKAMPGLRIVSETVPCESTIDEEVEKGVTAAIDDIFAALTRPLTPEEKSPKTREMEESRRISFKGNLGEVNGFFYKRGWTDGLPIIPPTEQAVSEMLTGTDLPAEHIVGKVSARFGKATVEKIAINAVMAGALPTYMPLLIAGVEALIDPKTNLGWAAAGTGSHSPCWIINGPVRKDLNINSGSGYLNPGNIANATIGRAMRLILNNIGGNRPGIEDMSVHGYAGKYTMVIAENEEDSPWEPMHVEYGFNKEDSTISLFCPDSYAQFMPYGTSDKGILNAVIYNIIPARWGSACIVLIPAHARTLASTGFLKKDIVSFISEHAKIPAYQHPEFTGATRTGPLRISGRGEPSLGRLPLNPADTVRILFYPEWIRVIVAGGAGNYIGVHQSGGGFLADWVTKKAVLPKNWDKLVSKYKNLVPTHVIY